MPDGGDRHAGWNASLIGDPHSALSSKLSPRGIVSSAINLTGIPETSISIPDLPSFSMLLTNMILKTSITLETKCTPASQMMAVDSHFWCVA